MGLTTIDHQYEDMGRISFEMLIQQIEGHRRLDPGQVANRVLSPQLAVRET
jgi:DNA-binding LacI/PurR family transcriptional regulator